MDKDVLNLKMAGLLPWWENFGHGMERRGRDGMSWYDMSINCNAEPCKPSLAVIVTAWSGQLKWLTATLESYRRSGAFVILAYDNPFYPWMPVRPDDIFRVMPSQNHYVLASAVVHKHITYDADKRNGWFWDVRYAQGLIKSFPNIKHVYCTNGDCLVERPEGFSDIIDLMDDAELMAGQSNASVIHTADMMFTVDAFNRIMDYIFERMRVPVIGSLSPEKMTMEAVKQLGIRVKHAPNQPLDTDGTLDCYARHGQSSTWRELLGFRNLFAEQETAWNNGLEPLPRGWFDDYRDWIYFSGDERETLCRYFDSQDRRYLMQWWDRGEDSDYNRLYYPLEYYGSEPIYK